MYTKINNIEFIDMTDIDKFIYLMKYHWEDEWLHLNGSVPQGSGLRPFLYVVMINDISADGFMSHISLWPTQP